MPPLNLELDLELNSDVDKLASSVPSLHLHICAAITECGDIAKQSLRDQWHQIILCRLSKL
jgi:hypothetical protein